mmetsp:Transcript_13851/g.16704  ORF Transcript_13851/g.16704 Transcript_13851/m.16704 type:complete len:117 (+) Transcript_13851:431-781(+)
MMTTGGEAETRIGMTIVETITVEMTIVEMTTVEIVAGMTIVRGIAAAAATAMNAAKAAPHPLVTGAKSPQPEATILAGAEVLALRPWRKYNINQKQRRRWRLLLLMTCVLHPLKGG